MRITCALLVTVLVPFLAACALPQAPATEPATHPPDTDVTSSPAGSPLLEPAKNPYAPLPTDSSLTRGEVFIKEMGVLVRESYPPQISLSLSGALPTPCYQLRMQINEPDEEHKIHVEAYSVVDPDMICTQVLEPFQASIDLGTFPSGHYSVWVNGELAGEFDS
jgi:hypothetical protein